MTLPLRDFAIWMLSDLAIRENVDDRITFTGNHICAQHLLPIRSLEETDEQFAARRLKFQKSLPRRSDFSKRLAFALRAFMLDGEKSEYAAYCILVNLRDIPARKKAEYERAGIGYAFRPIDPPIGSTRRNHRTKTKKRGISAEERQVHAIRTQACRYIRKDKNFDAHFSEELASFQERFCRDEEWYVSAEKCRTARVEAFEKLDEPFDWYSAMPVAAAAQLYHEQRKVSLALLYYRKAIRAARRAEMNERFRAFVIYWLRLEIKLCEHFAGMLLIPGYKGPRLPLAEFSGTL